MASILVLSLLGLFLAWYALDTFLLNRKRRNSLPQEQMEAFRKLLAGELKPETIILEPGTKFDGGLPYDLIERKVAKRGFRNLGDFKVVSGTGDTKTESVTRVLSHPEGKYILAISFENSVRFIQCETRLADGTWLYSTNNRNVLVLKSPSRIKVNRLSSYYLEENLEAHEAFLESEGAQGIVTYENIQQVVESMHEQTRLRDELLKEKEFPIDEEEMVALARFGWKRNVRWMYARMREMRKNQ